MATFLKDALRAWEDENKTPMSRAVQINLSYRNPPIQKLDNTISMLTSCEFLSLSSNTIEKITGLQRLRNLRILSLARNNIKDLTGLEAVGESLEQLWISYNLIEKLKVLTSLKQLSVLYISHNTIKDWSEVQKLQELTLLRDVTLQGNPIAENVEEEKYRADVAKRLLQIKMLDGETIIRE